MCSNRKKKSSSSAKLKDESDLQGHQSTSGASGAVALGSRDATPIQTKDEDEEMNAGKTEAEIRFFAVQRKRLAEKAAKGAKLSHKDRVAAFNEKLESLSEHHDIPKVGPG